MSDNGLGQALLSVLRSILIAAGGYVTGRGWLDSATVNEIIGLAMILIPAAWGAWQKFSAEAATKERETVAVQAGAEAKALGAIRAHSEITPARAQTLIKTLAPEKGPSL